MGITNKEAHVVPLGPGVTGERRPLFGNFSNDGVQVAWYDFECLDKLNWSKQLLPKSLELCINFDGCGTISDHSTQPSPINPQTVLQYSGGSRSIQADRQASQRHRFLTVIMSKPWLTHTIHSHRPGLNSETRAFLSAGRQSPQIRSQRLNSHVKRLAEEMLAPPVPAPCQGLWYHARIQEILAHTLTETRDELFCERHKRVANERIDQVKKILAENLEYPPSLAELGRRVGCSPYHLSRLFSEHTGTTISRHLRTLRLERAAELLREGRCNVTEAAMTVGYSSLSHFSKAFAEMFGECPCVFGLKK